jgi:hypothetical protein
MYRSVPLCIRYSFLLISNIVFSLSPTAEQWALESPLHKTTYRPLIYMALYAMLLIRANPLLGQVRGGWALEISTFLGPKWHSPNAQCHFTGPNPFPTNVDLSTSKALWWGLMNYRSINSYCALFLVSVFV